MDAETQILTTNRLNELMFPEPVPGEVWYMVCQKWFDAFKNYLENLENKESAAQALDPGPIDNAVLIDTNEFSGIRPNLIEELDYALVPSVLWNILVRQFGLEEGQEPIQRTVISTGVFKRTPKIEIYPLQVRCCVAETEEHATPLCISKGESLKTLRNRVLAALNINNISGTSDSELSRQFRLYQKLENDSYEELKPSEDSIYDMGITENRLLVLDVGPPTGQFKLKTCTSVEDQQPAVGTSTPRLVVKASGSSVAAATSSVTRSGTPYGTGVRPTTFGLSSTPSPPQQPTISDFDRRGLVGLSNLGNTCFMNSGLQCLSNCPDLTQYFYSNRWEDEVNETNRLGTRGELARNYADLIKSMWNGKCNVIAPRELKQAIGHFKDTFLGYQQHDSQELISFLLDGLHEDLNRVKIRPQIESKDSDGRPDAEVANEAWDNYKKRNDSVIVDHFHFQIKSTVTCNEKSCSKVSVTFDPICFLGLPLVQRKDRVITFTLVSKTAADSLSLRRVLVPKNGTVNDLKETVAKQFGLSARTLAVADFAQGRLYSVREDSQSLSNIMDRDETLVYELKHELTDDVVLVQVHHRVHEKTSSRSFCHMSSAGQHFGLPLLLAIPKKNLSYETLYNEIYEAVRFYVHVPADGEKWWSEREEGDDDSGVEENGGDADECSEPSLFKVLLSTGSGYHETVNADKNLDEYLKTASNRIQVTAEWHRLAYKRCNTDLALKRVEHESFAATAKAKQKAVQLRDCLDLFTSQEQLGIDDTWYCPKCKTHRQAYKKLSLWRLPKILIVHLKRFSYSRYYRDKIESLIDFPLTGLDLSDWVENPQQPKVVYDLIAVSNHMGGLGGGHYTAYAKNQALNTWVEFDDSHVEKNIPPERIISKSAYLLVYRARDGEEEPMDTSA